MQACFGIMFIRSAIPACILLTLGLTATAQDSLKATILEGITITGQFEPQSARRSVYQVKTIPLEKIAGKGAVYVQDVLNTELNIRFSQDQALGGSNLTMQGLAGQNVKVLIDGMPMVGRQGSSNEININQINISSIERIEIIEGPMSVVYGSDALAGVINIITKKPDEEKLDLSAKVHEETAGTEYGLGKGVHNESIGIGYGKGIFRLRADGGRNFFGGWQGNAEGRDKQWQPKTQYVAGVTTGIEKNGLSAHYRLDYLFENIYNPGEFAGGEAIDQNYITNRFMHQVQASHTFSEKLQANGALSFTDYQRQTQTTTVDETSGDRRLALGSGLQDVTKFDGLTLRSTATYKASTALSFQPGIDFNYEWGSGGRIKAGTQSIGDFAVFLSAQWKVAGHTEIRPGIRSIYNTVYSAPPVVPSINTKTTIGDRHEIRLAYGRGFRAPSLRELYFDFFDASHSIEGNTNLEAEHSGSFNGSWVWRLLDNDNGKSLSTTLGGFYNSVDNMIGYGQKPGNTLVTTYINIDKYKTEGFTLNTAWKSRLLDMSAGAGYTGRYNQLAESDSDLDKFVWSPEITSSGTYRIPKAGINISLYYKFTGITPFYEVVTGEDGTQEFHLAKIGSYHWADLTLRKEFKKHISLATGVRNLFDVKQVNNTALTSGAHTGGSGRAVGYGRSLFFNITYNLN